MTHLREMMQVEPLWYRFFGAGFPSCHERCARNYFVVLWDLGENHETEYKIGMN